MHPDFNPDGIRHPVFGLEGHISRICQVAIHHIVITLFKLHILDEFGLQEMEVGISLAVGMAHHIDRHTVNPKADVCAVVEIESTQKHLLGLSSSGVLGDEKSGDGAQYLL